MNVLIRAILHRFNGTLHIMKRRDHNNTGIRAQLFEFTDAF